MKAESLIFDIDGTLWDSRALIAEGYNRQLRKENLAHLCITAEDLRVLFGRVLSEIADAIFSTVPVPERYALMDRCVKCEEALLEADPCRVGYPGVKETLEQLAKNHRLFIVSNSQVGYPELCMEKLGIGHLFSGHLCHGDTGTDKGQTIRTLVERHGLTSCCYIGDTQGDYEATVKAGVPFVWAAYGFGSPERWDDKAEKFADLLNIFED